jgi:hypothetical protein
MQTWASSEKISQIDAHSSRTSNDLFSYHALERLVAGCKVRILRTVVLIRRDDTIVSANLRH